MMIPTMPFADSLILIALKNFSGQVHRWFRKFVEASICQHKLCGIEVWRMPNGKKARQPHFKIFWCNCVKSDSLTTRMHIGRVFHWIGGWILERSQKCWTLVACRFLRWDVEAGVGYSAVVQQFVEQIKQYTEQWEEKRSDSISHSESFLWFLDLFLIFYKVQNSWEILKGQNFSTSAFAPDQRWEQQLWSATRSRTGKKICISHRRGWIQWILWTRCK